MATGPHIGGRQQQFVKGPEQAGGTQGYATDAGDQKRQTLILGSTDEGADHGVQQDTNRKEGHQAEKGKEVMGGVVPEGTAPVGFRALQDGFGLEQWQDVAAQAQQQKQGKKQQEQGDHFPPSPPRWSGFG